MSEQPNWIALFEDFVAESEPAKLEERLVPLETSIFERLQELHGTPEGQEERLAIKMAADQLLEIKTAKLDFPAVRIA